MEKSIVLYYSTGSEMLSFGVRELISACGRQGINVITDNIANCPPIPPRQCIRVTFDEYAILFNPKMNQECYDIQRNGNSVTLRCSGEAGAMYGLLDLAETIDYFGYDAITDKSVEPVLEKRGLKFNIPFEPLENGDPFEKNIGTFFSRDFWRDYIDMMAKNRYNMLSLWSEHPYHLMFRLGKYPDTCPFDDQEMEWYKEFWSFIFGYAKIRNVKIYIITWNIRLPGFAAKGLGLPEIIGNHTQYDNNGYYGRNDALRSGGYGAKFDNVRQTLPVVQDYIKECIKTLILEYPDLAGIGTNCAEEMVGNAQVRQQWVEEAYVAALKETGRPISFIMRTNMGSGALAEDFLTRCPGDDNYISWKYSVAHMYSSTRPRFEEFSHAWDNIKHPEKLNVLFTIRNDDFNTFRWGDCDFIKKYMETIAEKSYCKGYYWGCDGYLYGDDFQHVPHGHKTWKYDFERHWQEFELLGRFGYEADIPEELWVRKFIRRYGENGQVLYNALKEASRLIPYVNRLHWLDVDFRWHPECLLSKYGFKNVIDTLYNPSMPLSGTVSIRDFAKAEAAGEAVTGETPLNIISALSDIEVKLDEYLRSLDLPHVHGEGECLIWDLHCWRQLCEFYRHRFTGALELARLELTGDETHRTNAVECMNKEVPCWKLLAEYWSRHYMNYKMTRTQHYFGYGLYIKDVERDREFAEAFGKVRFEPSDLILRHGIMDTQSPNMAL
ncbi:MAG: hypothetical protein LBL09_01670 [Oscillospiraceae bacterium]|nr:hypothetical protein [Oscillospiraceae bacterium]